MRIKEGYKSLFVKNTLLSMAYQIISILSAFFLLPYMIWRLGDEVYGLWMILKIFSIGGYLSLAGIGFEGSIVRYLTKFHVEENAEEFKKLFFSGFTLFLAIGALCCLAVLVFNKYLFLSAFDIADTHASEMQSCLVIYACALLYQFPALALKAYYTSIQDFFRLKLWETLNVVLFFLLIVTIMFFDNNLLTIVCVETAVYFILFVIFLCLPVGDGKKFYSLSVQYFSLKSLKNVSGMTYYLFFNKISGIVYNKTPQIIIGCFLTSNFMTYYAIISRVPRAIKALQGMINAAVLPVAVSFETLNYRDKMKTLFLRGTRYSFLFLTPIVVFMVIYAEDFLRLWIGRDYTFLAPLFRGYVIWQYVTLLVAFGSSMYTKKEHFKKLLPYTILANIIFLCSSIMLVKRLELWSILIGLLLSGFIGINIKIKLIHKINGFSFRAFFDYILKVPVIYGLLFCAAILLLLKAYAPFDHIFWLIIYAVVMYVSYMVFVYRFGLFDFEKREISTLRQKR